MRPPGISVMSKCTGMRTFTVGGVARPRRADSLRMWSQTSVNCWGAMLVACQASPKNKITYFHTLQNSCTCDLTSTAATRNYAPEASTQYFYDPVHLPQITWTYAATSRLLFEAGGGYLYQTIDSRPVPEASLDDIGVTELLDAQRFQASVDNFPQVLWPSIRNPLSFGTRQARLRQ